MFIEVDKVTGHQRRGRHFWKCNYCDEVQYITANSWSKPDHLRSHGITQNGRKTPLQQIVREKATENVRLVSTRAEKEGITNLVTAVKFGPFKNALVTWIVMCQLSLSLAVNELFIEFLQVLYPSVEALLPSASNTIRKWVLEAFEDRQKYIQEDLRKAISKIHFSFDLWTSPNHLALMGVVAHYIDEFGQNQSVSALSLETPLTFHYYNFF